MLVTAPAHAVADADVDAVDAVDATAAVVAAADAAAADLTSMLSLPLVCPAIHLYAADAAPDSVADAATDVFVVPAACLSCSHALLHALASASAPTIR